jgi:tRNA threonylcarbamoyladenosine biosynthesis protein TsaE
MTTWVTHSEDETKSVARSFAAQLQRGAILALTGALGSGKTRFVKGVCEAFGVQEHVMSPSFVLLNRYTGRDAHGHEVLMYHLDLYRITSLEELYDIGVEEFFYGDGIVMVEWAELLGELLPARRFDIRLSFGETSDERRIEIEERHEPSVSPSQVQQVVSSTEQAVSAKANA